MPQILTIILVLIGAMAVFAVIFWILIKKALAPKDENKNGDRAALMMQEQLKDIKEALHKTNLTSVKSSLFQKPATPATR